MVAVAFFCWHGLDGASCVFMPIALIGCAFIALSANFRCPNCNGPFKQRPLYQHPYPYIDGCPDCGIVVGTPKGTGRGRG